MSERSDELLIEDILDAARKILRYTDGLSFEKFVSDERTVDAVVRNFGVIGEAANRLSPDFKAKHPQIEWNRIRGFRNRIVHDYFGTDYSIVWIIVQNYLTDLERSLRELSA